MYNTFAPSWGAPLVRVCSGVAGRKGESFRPFLLLLRVRGEEVTHGGFDCSLFGFLFVEPFKNVFVRVAVQF